MNTLIFLTLQKQSYKYKGVNTMSTTFAITTFIELAISILLVYGFMHEDKVIAFEQAVKRIVIGNIRRTIRISHQRKVVEINEQVTKSNQNVA